MLEPTKLALKPQHLRWQVGRYHETFTAGPYARTRGRTWEAEREGEQHNLILDNAYELMGSNGLLNLSDYAAVGTGSTAPAATDTTLVAELVRTNYVPSGEADSWDRPSDGVYNINRVREFTETQVGGQNLTEWGWGIGSTINTADIMTRELFRDGTGTPITLTLATDQRLRLYYTYQVTLTPVTATAFSMPITGYTGSPVTGNYVLNHVKSSLILSASGAGDLELVDTLLNDGVSNTYMNAYSTASLATYNDTTHAYSPTSIAVNPNAYVSGSRVKTMPQVTFGTADANFNIAMLSISTHGSQVDPPLRMVLDVPIPKDNLHKLIFNSWNILTW